MKKLQKPIAVIIITGLVLSLNFNIFKPKQVQAFDVIGGPANIVKTIKAIALDAVAWTIKDRIINVLKRKIVDWGMGRKSAANQPFAVSDWVQYFKEAAERGVAKYIADFEQTKIEPEIKQVLENLGLTTLPGDLAQYHQYAESTLEQDLGTEKYQQFKNSGYSLSAGGWDAWFSMMKPQNNLFGQIMMAQAERARREAEEKQAADKEVIGGSIGYKNETVTTKTDQEACDEGCDPGPSPITCSNNAECEQNLYAGAECLKGVCAMPGSTYYTCVQNCELKPGIAIETKIKNYGSTIEKHMTDALGADMAKIIQVDEITEILGIAFSALLNRAIDGMGMAFNAITATSKDRTRAESKQKYSYLRSFKNTQTIGDIKDVRTNVLNTILKAMQSLNRTGIRCTEDEMTTYREWNKNVAEIANVHVEALYAGLEGANLSPDFEVLDPRFAPYSVYGYGWSQVPANKFPDKCRTITDQLNLGLNATCQSIKSGLEPNYSAQCETCMYDYDALSCPPGVIPPQPYPQAGQADPWADKNLIIQKQDFYNACRGPYLTALDRCDECLKKADEKCDQVDIAQKNECISNHCSNYSGITDQIVGSITDGLDFYNKCLIEEKKDACYTCTKEYFVPATFCEQVADYTARAIDKYPTVVKREVSGGDDKGEFWGPKDKGIADLGDECDDNFDSQPMDVALLCRIMPDFTYGGQKICETMCNKAGMTTEELRDVTDFRPNDKDCAKATIPIGGKNPWNPISDGTYYIRGKCCAALWQHDKEKYNICVGSGESTTVEKPSICKYGIAPEKEPWCYCKEDQRPLATKHNGKPLFKTAVTASNPEGTCANACSDTAFTVPKDMKYVNAVEVSSNAAPAGSVMFIAENSCRDPDFSTCQTTAGPCDYVANGPSKSICEQETKRAKAGVGYCLGGGGAATGADRFTCDLSAYAGQSLNAGVYNNTNNGARTDGTTGIDVCIPCDPNDAGYPNYGTVYNQCEGKI